MEGRKESEKRRKKREVKDERGEILVENVQVKRRLAEYFEGLLNLTEEREAEIAAV